MDLGSFELLILFSFLNFLFWISVWWMCIDYFFIMRKYTQDKNYHCNHLKVCNSVALSTFTVLCNYQRSLVPVLTHHPIINLFFHPFGGCLLQALREQGPILQATVNTLQTWKQPCLLHWVQSRRVKWKQLDWFSGKTTIKFNVSLYFFCLDFLLF